MKGGLSMRDKNNRLSKFISLILRHHPEAAYIQVDEHGWAKVDELIQGINRTGRHIDLETLEKIVATDEKGRYSFNDDHKCIRANQGHSIPVDIGLKPVEPPEYLYHGTATRFLDSIHKEGLTRQSRLYVHLSPDEATAQKVGARHGKSVVLMIKAKALCDAGQQFFLSKNGVWLCEHIPVQYIEFGSVGT